METVTYFPDSVSLKFDDKRYPIEGIVTRDGEVHYLVSYMDFNTLPISPFNAPRVSYRVIPASNEAEFSYFIGVKDSLRRYITYRRPHQPLDSLEQPFYNQGAPLQIAA